MMKSFLVLLVLTATAAFSTEASATICKIDLKNGQGRLLTSFTGYGYNYYAACREARQDCQRVQRSGYYRARVQRCVERGVVRPRPRVESCTAVMKNWRGYRVDTFYATSGPRQRIGACARALRQCQNAKVRQGRRGASCSILTRGAGRGRGRI